MLSYGDAIRRLHSLGLLLLMIGINKYGVLSNDFEVYRGLTDRFSNPECLQDSGRCEQATCTQYFAACGEDNCDFCRCDKESKTYVATERRCVRNEEICRRSEPQYSTFAISDTQEENFLTAENSKLVFINKYTGKANQHWMYTRSGQLMNMGNLQCIDASQQYDVAVRPCRTNGNESQEWMCNRSMSGLYQEGHTQKYLSFQSQWFIIRELGLVLYEWLPYGIHTSQSICDRQDIYQGCYRYYSGDFVANVHGTWEKGCKNKTPSDCFEEMRIAAPILVENSQCSLLWDKSTYSVHDQAWTSVSGHPNHFSVLNAREEGREIKLKMYNDAKVIWAGALLKLEIQCKDAVRSEQHCVLLKFHGFYKKSPAVSMSTITAKNSYKSSTIALSVILCVLLLFVFGAFVLRRRNVNMCRSWFTKDEYTTQNQPFCEGDDGPI